MANFLRNTESDSERKEDTNEEIRQRRGIVQSARSKNGQKYMSLSIKLRKESGREQKPVWGDSQRFMGLYGKGYVDREFSKLEKKENYLRSKMRSGDITTYEQYDLKNIEMEK